MWPLFCAGLVLNLAGLGAGLHGWIAHRHPGQPFWAVAPIWRASQFLQPTGVRLWVAGTAAALVGATCMWIALLRPLFA